jgi:hypothetical protein
MTTYERIQQHLSEPDAVIVVATYSKATEYSAKHAAWFTAPTRAGETGVYVRSGRGRVYVFPQYVRFGRYVTKANLKEVSHISGVDR